MARTALNAQLGIACVLLVATACSQPQTSDPKSSLCSTTAECAMGYTCDATTRHCAGILFPLKGSVDGLEDSRTLQLQQGDEVITLSANGPFAFASQIQQDAPFAVQVVAQPRGLICTVSPATGIMNGDATSIEVKCARAPASCFYDRDCEPDSYCDVAQNACKPSNFTLTGEVVGLGSKQSIVLVNHNDALTVQGSRTFTFAVRLRDQDSYDVKIGDGNIAKAPRYHRCQVTGGAGVATGNVTSVRVDCTCTADTFPDRLQCLPIAWDESGFYGYVFYLTQPLDHAKPEGLTFTQRAAFSLTSGGGPKDRPLAIGTDGYLLGYPFRRDPAVAFGGYDLRLEHRYFGNSWPRNSAGGALPRDVRYLNVKQTADDVHAWIQAIKPYVTGPRIMTGVSKGGVHSLISTFYYPDDVNATVAYVAPNIHGLNDPVFADWINNRLGGDAYATCRRSLIDFIIQALRRRAEITALVTPDAETLRRYPGRSIETAVQESIFKLRWSFWQYNGPSDSLTNCNTIPRPNSANFAAEALVFVNQVGNVVTRIDWDPSNDWGSTWWWQSNTEMGTVNYGENIPELTRELDQSLVRENGPTEFPLFMDQRMIDVEGYIANAARHVILIYGALDPWSGNLYTVNNEKDSYVFVAPKLNHNAAIKNLTAPDYEKALVKLEGWLGVRRGPDYTRVDPDRQ